MKTLIYALCSKGHGTKKLAKALTNLSIIGGHEIIGNGDYGSIQPVPNHLAIDFHFPGDYEVGEPIGGFVGDNRLTEAFFQWNSVRFHDTYCSAEVLELQKILLEAMRPYITGDGFFIDISSHLADWYPLIEDLASAQAFQTRAVHLTKDGRQWIQKLMFHKALTSDATHYGSVHNSKTIYPPLIPGTEGMTRFEQVCHVWADLHAWFLKSNRKVFHVEDFNKGETAKALLEELFPEADYRQRKTFTLYDEKYGTSGYVSHPGWVEGSWGFPSYDSWNSSLKDIFESICGDMMRTLGYWKEEIKIKKKPSPKKKKPTKREKKASAGEFDEL